MIRMPKNRISVQKIVMKTFGISVEFDIDIPESADDDEIRTYSKP